MFSRIIFIIVLLFSSATIYANDQYILLQSTTSAQNSGLYDYLLPKFTKQTGIQVRVVAVGTGQALRNAKNGDGDVLIVHAKSAEEQFVAEGYGVERFDLMYNDFVIVGPKNDPAKVIGSNDITQVLTKIASSKTLFASRGDDSGTHIKELSLWQGTQLNPADDSGQWYREMGSGMGTTLNAAVAMQAYTMTDRATWLNFGNKQNFVILFEGVPPLFNQYGVIIVSPDKHPHVKLAFAEQFVFWLLSEKGQAEIASYKVKGEQLFFPNARP